MDQDAAAKGGAGDDPAHKGADVDASSLNPRQEKGRHEFKRVRAADGEGWEGSPVRGLLQETPTRGASGGPGVGPAQNEGGFILGMM